MQHDQAVVQRSPQCGEYAGDYLDLFTGPQPVGQPDIYVDRQAARADGTDPSSRTSAESRAANARSCGLAARGRITVREGWSSSMTLAEVTAS